MNAQELGTLSWIKSSYTTQENCVEVAGLPQAVAVRDSKDPHGPALVVSRATFGQFVCQVRES